jgi:hypothetical protein
MYDMQVGLTEAAELTGKSPSTLTRAVNNGRLSATPAPDGSRLFDVAVLERVFGQLRKPGEARTGADDVQRTDLHDALEEARRAQIVGYEREIRHLEQMLEETRKERDRWQEQAGQITRLLTDQRAQADRDKERLEAELTAMRQRPKGQGREPNPSFGLIARLFGRAA